MRGPPETQRADADYAQFPSKKTGIRFRAGPRAHNHCGGEARDKNSTLFCHSGWKNLIGKKISAYAIERDGSARKKTGGTPRFFSVSG